MARFTSSPYEYMMTRMPSVSRAEDDGSVPAPSDKCRGCPYGRARPCVGFCMKCLLSDMGTKRRKHETELPATVKPDAKLQAAVEIPRETQREPATENTREPEKKT